MIARLLNDLRLKINDPGACNLSAQTTAEVLERDGALEYSF